METTTHTPSKNYRIERPEEGRVLAGVAAGIANRAGVSVGLVRLGFIVAAFFGGFGVLLYLAAWALMPETGEAESAAERWLDRLRDPERRIGALLIGLAVAIIVISLAPITAVAIVALIIGGALLSTERAAQPAVTESSDAHDEFEPQLDLDPPAEPAEDTTVDDGDHADEPDPDEPTA